MKNLFFISFLILASCDLGDQSENNEIGSSFNSEEFTVFGHQVLTSDLNIEARKVIFAPGTTIKSGAYSISISADEVQFNDAQIYSYDVTEMGDCYEDGSRSGSVYLNSKMISGSPSFHLSGQKAGRNGWGYLTNQNNNEFYDAKDKLAKGNNQLVIHSCKRTIPFTKKNWDEYWISKVTNAGDFGFLKINVDSNLETFTPEIVSTVSRGDFQFMLNAEFGQKLFQRGQSKGPMQVCFYDYKGFESCGEDYLKLASQINSPFCFSGECKSI